MQCTYTWLKGFIKTNKFYLFFPALRMYSFMYLLTWNTLLWSSRMHWRCNGKCMWVQNWDITLWLVDLLLDQNECIVKHSPTCSANPIMVTPIWKWWFANGAHPIWFTMHCSLTEKEVKSRLQMKDYKWGRKWKFKSLKISNESPLQIPLG